MFKHFQEMVASRIAWRLAAERYIESGHVEREFAQRYLDRVRSAVMAATSAAELLQGDLRLSPWVVDALDQFEDKVLSTGQDARRIAVRLVTDILVVRQFLHPVTELDSSLATTVKAAKPEQPDVKAMEARLAGFDRLAASRPELAKRLWAIAKSQTNDFGPWAYLVKDDSHPIVEFLRHAHEKHTQVRELLRLLPTTSPPVEVHPSPKAKSRNADSKPKPVEEPLAKREQATGESLRLEKKLWSGFSESALKELNFLIYSRSTHKDDLSNAAWVLARWHAFHNDFSAALGALALARTARPERGRRSTFYALEARCLVELGRLSDAIRLVDEEIDTAAFESEPELRYTVANLRRISGDENGWLEWSNRAYLAAGLAPLLKRDTNHPLTLSNLRSADVPSHEDGPLVSVLMPIYRASDTVVFALRSVLDQTWRNIEVIVVDDCSPDDTAVKVRQVAATDGRVKLIQLPRNGGAYAARNVGLGHATGEYITVADGDDWSHPQKIATEVSRLRSNRKAAAVHLHWIRVLADGQYVGSWRPGGEMVSTDLSSLMYRREILTTFGPWDEVQAGADTEYMWRVQAALGAKSIEVTLPGTPLSLALHQPTSLTRASATHARTMMYGVRRNYREAVQHWHRTLAEKDPGRIMLSEWRINHPHRQFAAPRRLLTSSPSTDHYDLIVVMDFNIGGGAFVSTLNYINAATALGLRVAVLQWRRYDLDPQKPLNDKILELAASERITILAAEDNVTTKVVLVGYPVILQHMIDRPPAIETQIAAIVVNQMAARLFSGGDPQYDPLVASENAQRAFGKQPVWVPISGLVRRLMAADARYPAAYSQTWNPLIDLREYGLRNAVLGVGERPPVIGRHCRDHYTKWPSDPRQLELAYCADRDCEVRLLGGIDKALEVMGRVPKNWIALPFDHDGAQGFLRGLDFFVHYPHEDYIEEFGRAVLEAMAVGVPAILPPVFQGTFGEAALYVEPERVWPTVSRLWNDREAYARRVLAGRRFAEAVGSYSSFRDRFALLIGDTNGEENGTSTNNEGAHPSSREVDGQEGPRARQSGPRGRKRAKPAIAVKSEGGRRD